ncbi:MAG: putative subtilisin-like proprotein convertase domain protein [Ignavibacteria bacterium]|nr:putative subtilisin-like proprotein convertase domain protein [Ignavibacteria bacterium]
MKSFVLTTTLLIILLSNIAFGAYCKPPKYKSGPYTAIAKVEIGGISKQSGLSDGYSDYTSSVSAAKVTKGKDVSISIELYYNPSMLSMFEGNLNVRVWIDWNQDEDFADPSEEVVASVKNCSSVNMSNPTVMFTTSFNVPSTAKTGTTRMRVYEDMPFSDGHINPNPCGYLNSNNGLGQHGECEDYAITISSGTPVKHKLTVNKGSGTGSYLAGTNVVIIAEQPQPGFEFDTWKGHTDYLDDLLNDTANVNMPDQDIILTASYKALTFSFTLTLQWDDKPLVGANVDLSGTKKVTDNSGTVVFPLISYGQKILTITKANFKDIKDTIILIRDSTLSFVMESTLGIDDNYSKSSQIQLIGNIINRNSGIDILYDGLNTESIKISIFNMSGSIMLNDKVTLNPGLYKIKLNQNMVSGIYFINFKLNEYQVTKQIILIE